MSNPWVTAEQLETGSDNDLRDLKRLLDKEQRDRERQEEIESEIIVLNLQIAKYEAKRDALQNQL